MVREITNPYIAGTPLHTRDVFYGRDDIFESIRLKLRGRFQDNPVFMYGQRRMGKTSILLQIQNEGHLGPEYLPIYINLQGVGLTRQGMSGFLYDVATEICQAVRIDKPKPDEFSEDPQTYFRHVCLPRILSKIGNKHLLLLFDEYETLGERVKACTLEEAIFRFLRTLMAGERNLSFIFAGNHTPEDLGGHYPAAFGRTLFQGVKVSFLKEDEAAGLITEPAAEWMRYDDQAVEMTLQLTSGHPFFIQLLCQYLFIRHAEEMRNLPEDERVSITLEDVEETIGEIIAGGENQLQEIWTEYFSHKEKVVLAGATAALNSATTTWLSVPSVPRAKIDSELDQFGSRFEEGEVIQILEVLTDEKGVLKCDPRTSHYRFAVDLLRRWISNSQDLRELASELPIIAGAKKEVEPSGWSRTARAVTPFLIAGLILATLCGTIWRFHDLWFPFIQGPIPIAEVTPTSTATFMPTRAPTHARTAMPMVATPTSTPTTPPTPTQTPTPTQPPPVTPPTHTPTSTPIPKPVRPELVAPAQGGTYRNSITFQWSGRLSASQAYQVTAYHLESGYIVQSERLTPMNWTVDLPAERYGEWRWRVSVVRDGSALVTSVEWMFWFNPGPSGPSSGPPPTDPVHQRPP